jgi:RecA-family ATPase
MAKDRDVNDILREKGEDAARAFHDSAERFDENNPKFKSGKANGSHADKGIGEVASIIPDLDDRGDKRSNAKQLLLSSAAFTKSFTPPDFLIEGILCRQYIYALTGHPGRGKTAVALLLAGLVGEGRRLGNLDVDKGCVLILAGENPTDSKMRWIALGQQMDFDVETADVHFIEGTFKISEKLDAIHREVEALGGVDFVIVDSSAAYFEGDDENDNTQAGNHARLLRELTTLKGGPCVLVLCHPPKGAGEENLQPRGGGSFLAEVTAISRSQRTT